ncbi:TonB-dependent receptor plug domain-containing protein [Aquimarina litoralis]|uniref:TonB-dependent receptor plug domain-containing protein n=1 Tax=Aquimarina litoralis TaxID=584605 RepID=UPI001C560DF7|nr:TonB-dependent receptor plug domain-containing protein [Aquimarina litoralis]MBW1295863.1 TonB-dependent receptor plug domain-containing protein [Aquimarina litoralis]
MKIDSKHIKRGIVLFLLSAISIAFTVKETQPNLIEKIYTQTDRSFYFPGETIWFKSYVTDSEHKITKLSEVLYAELISPKGAIVKSWNLSIQQGYSYGHFDIQKDWVGGIYTLKMYTQWMRNYGEDAFFTKKITVQKIVQPNLLLKLKFEKESYGKSSEVVANFEVKDLKNNPLKNKEITFEVAIAGQKTYSKSIQTNELGKANPAFVLPSDLNTSDVILNILVPHQGSTESISRSVPVLLDTIDLQFFPESGKIIAGTKNTIAFKAINEFGKPADISGDIIDEKGNYITKFSSYHDGMGGFDIDKVSKNSSYYAQIKEPFVSEKKFLLPKVYEDGVRFSVMSDSLQTRLKIFSNNPKELKLEISNSTGVLANKKIKSNQKIVTVDTKDFPKGIAKFTLLTEENIPIAERLVFLNLHKELNINISLNKEQYETREKVEMTIETTDSDGVPISSNLSVAVANNKLLSFADDKQDHIISYFLMSSELKGKIHKPVFYFDQEEPKASKALDYVMLTHGWRDYLINNEITMQNSKFGLEQKSIQSGTVVNKKGAPVKAYLIVFDPNGNKAFTMKTKEDGRFSFKLERKSYTMIAYTDTNTSLRIIKDKPNQSKYANVKSSIIKDSSEIQGFFGVKKPLQKKISKKAKASIALGEDGAALEEVVIVGYSVTNKKSITGSKAIVQSEEIEEGTDPIGLLQGRIGGIQISNADRVYGNSSKINIRGAAALSGNSQPLIVVDGVPMNVADFNVMNTSNIESVTVLKDAAAASIYGCRGNSGVILITSKNGNYFNNWNKKKLNNAKFNNYAVEFFNDNVLKVNYIEKKFYIPVYQGVSLPSERTDFRQTIYWNPVVQTDELGQAKISFYNTDEITSFKITAEGLGYNGLIGRKEKNYSTKKLLRLAFKAPNYLTINDTVVLPVTIINESTQRLKTDLALELPESIKLLDSINSEVIVEANSSMIKNIKVVPVLKENKTFITASVKSNEYSDTIKKEATILSPYFPTQVSISGDRDQSFDFHIDNVVGNSLKAEVTVYTDIVGDVMNGIESMIQQPYGCFEQTSSSTYPNILVLKYLRETGKSNPEIEKKAMDFIKKGYKRLIGFETKEGGFEWFGKTPPHETLTAYGLLEFTEMKEVYSEVDQKMIDRTVNWLMSRKDGKGGFKKSKKGYDSFASSPLNVANAYIVYAISESGIQTDLSKEYQVTYNEALKSNDVYRMALLAAASFNYGENEKGNTLLAKIKEHIEEFGFGKLAVENTITRSYGDSKNIETVAFTLLALMKEEHKDYALISKGIEYLVSKRKHGRFGATQSTCMALKALIEYTKSQKSKIIGQDEALEIIINSRKLTQRLQINKSGKVEVKGLEDYITKGKQKIEINFQNSEHTFPYAIDIQWDSFLPDSSEKCQVDLKTTIANNQYKVGDNARMNIEVSNLTSNGLPMVTAIIGIPSGTSVQPWQLKEILEKEKVAFYEIFDNYLVFYWREFAPNEVKKIAIDLKADIAGKYQAPASTVYEYYASEYKRWIFGNHLQIAE